MLRGGGWGVVVSGVRVVLGHDAETPRRGGLGRAALDPMSRPDPSVLFREGRSGGRRAARDDVADGGWRGPHPGEDDVDPCLGGRGVGPHSFGTSRRRGLLGLADGDVHAKELLTVGARGHCSPSPGGSLLPGPQGGGSGAARHGGRGWRGSRSLLLPDGDDQDGGGRGSHLHLLPLKEKHLGDGGGDLKRLSKLFGLSGECGPGGVGDGLCGRGRWGNGGHGGGRHRRRGGWDLRWRRSDCRILSLHRWDWVPRRRRGPLGVGGPGGRGRRGRGRRGVGPGLGGGPCLRP